jgi:hypothetical protein
LRLLICAVAPWLLAVASVADLPPKIPVRDLFANPKIGSPRISDDGKTYAFVASDGDKQVIFSMGIEKGSKAVPLAAISDPENRLAWIEWANADRLLISGQARNPNATFVRARMTRLFGVNRDGTNFDWLGKRWPLFGQLQLPVSYQDEVLHWTPDDPGGVLLAFWPPYDDSPKVIRMDVATGRFHVVQGAREGIRSWHVDAAGQVRAGEETTLSNTYRLYARIEPDAKLEVVLEHPVFNAAPTFAGFHADPAKIYVMAPHEGRDAIFEFDLRARALGALVFAHPEVDVDGLLREPSGDRRVVGARFVVDRPEIRFFDATAESEHQALGRAFQREFDTPVSHERVSVSADGNRASGESVK